MLVIDGKAFPCHRKANVFLYCVELKETSSLNRNKLVSTSLQDIIYLHLWLVLGKNTQPSMAIMTVYRAVFCILSLDNSITSLSTGWPGQQRQISVWVHVNQWKMQFFCGGVAKCQLFSQAKGNFEIVELRALDVDNNQRLASSKSPLTTWTSLASVFR